MDEFLKAAYGVKSTLRIVTKLAFSGKVQPHLQHNRGQFYLRANPWCQMRGGKQHHLDAWETTCLVLKMVFFWKLQVARKEVVVTLSIASTLPGIGATNQQERSKECVKFDLDLDLQSLKFPTCWHDAWIEVGGRPNENPISKAPCLEAKKNDSSW